jgi:hypothetical protein
MINILKNIGDTFLNKYVGFYCGILIFLMPLFYRIRLFIECKRNIVLRKEALSELCSKEPYWEIENIPKLEFVNKSIKQFEFINVVSQALFDIRLFINNEPNENIGFKDCKMVPMFRINHFVDLYNKSLFSGFWSLFLNPVMLLDDKCSNIHIFKNKNDERIKMIIVIMYEKEYIKYFKFSNIELGINENKINDA